MNCPICGTKMLHYENPDRDICPNESNHKKPQGRPSGTTQKKSSKSGGRIIKGRKGFINQPKKKDGK